MAANSAVWTAETIADIAGYPLAGLLVAFLGTQLALAFWLDAATYCHQRAPDRGDSPFRPSCAWSGRPSAGAMRAFIDELRDGWHFLRASRRSSRTPRQRRGAAIRWARPSR